MKKLLRILLILVILFVVVIVGGYLYIDSKGIPTYEVDIPQIEPIKVTGARVDRGRKLAGMLCVNCHFNPETKSLTGKRLEDLPLEFGTAYSSNITQSKEAGIGNWTDAEIVYLLRTGLRPDGQYTPPWMPKFPRMADEDINSIIAFLRSSEMVVQSNDHVPLKSEPTFLVEFLCNVAFKPFDMPEEKIPFPNINDEVALGKYYALDALDCYACHSEDFKSLDLENPPNTPGFFGGGNPLLNMERELVNSANITMHESGIGSWTREEFIRCLRLGITPKNGPVNYPMVPYIELSDHEAGAIWDYLQTVPKIDNTVERYVAP